MMSIGCQSVQDMKDLINALLMVALGKSLTAKEALGNKGILGDDMELEAHELGQTLTEQKKFNAKRKFKAAALSVYRL